MTNSKSEISVKTVKSSTEQNRENASETSEDTPIQNQTLVIKENSQESMNKKSKTGTDKTENNNSNHDVNKDSSESSIEEAVVAITRTISHYLNELESTTLVKPNSNKSVNTVNEESKESINTINEKSKESVKTVKSSTEQNRENASEVTPIQNQTLVTKHNSQESMNKRSKTGTDKIENNNSNHGVEKDSSESSIEEAVVAITRTISHYLNELESTTLVKPISNKSVNTINEKSKESVKTLSEKLDKGVAEVIDKSNGNLSTEYQKSNKNTSLVSTKSEWKNMITTKRQQSIIKEILEAPSVSDLLMKRRQKKQDSLIFHPFVQGNRCFCKSPEDEPCAICYMEKIPCHCHDEARRYEDNESEFTAVISDIAVVACSVVALAILWSLQFWACIAQILCHAFKRFIDANFETQMGATVLVFILFVTILLHATLFTQKRQNMLAGKHYVKSYIKERKTVIIPGTKKHELVPPRYTPTSGRNTFKIEIKKNEKCTLKPKEQIFTLILLNEKMEKVYNASTKVLLPQCGEKPILVIVPSSFELEHY